MAPTSNTDIVLFHYTFSPYAKRIVWYLNFRKIPFSQCIQPMTMPRPDLSLLSIAYRRIPLISIGRSIYVDTRLILVKLEALFPASSRHPAISAPPSPVSFNSNSIALTRLLSIYANDAGIFARAAQLIPSSAPLIQDPKFAADRAQLTGRKWDPESVERMRPEAVTEIRQAFRFLEDIIFGDGRSWVLGEEGPSLADIEAVWPYHWLQTMPGALPQHLISATKFPKTFAWIKRFSTAAKAAMSANNLTTHGRPPSIDGVEAVARIMNAGYPEAVLGVDVQDPSGLRDGQEVELFPIDSGSANKDRGKLVGLSAEEIVIEIATEGEKTKKGVTRLHAPRHGFRVRALPIRKASL